MSPLALYIDQITSHVPVSPSQHPKVTVYPEASSPQSSHFFRSFRSTPTLSKARTNRIIIYPGTFNPPHRGHLHLLKHVFMRGAHDLNIIAAIILPHSDESVAAKVKREGGYFMFGRHDRSLLWTNDLGFPSWACVYEDSGRSFTSFLQRLSQVTEKDGYSLEYVPLYGPQIGSPSNPPDPAFGCKTIIMSDAARAAKFQRSSGRLRDFSGCTKWRRVRVDEEALRRHARAKANHALQAMNTISLPEARSMLEDGMKGMESSCQVFNADFLGTGPGYVEESTDTTVAKALEELKAVLTCQRKLDDGRTITLRFVKCEDIEPRKNYNDISSTIVRKIMTKQNCVKLEEALDWMVLSADLLWHCRASWIGKARQGIGHYINLKLPTEDLSSLEENSSDEEHRLLDDLPPLKKLKLCKSVQLSPSDEEPPRFEDPTLHEIPPSSEEVHLSLEPQSQDQPLSILDRKRGFPETGPEAEAEIIGDSVGGGCLAEDAKV